MNQALLKQLDLERHAKLLQRAAGVPCSVALRDLSGELVWTSDGSSETGIGRAISEIPELPEGREDRGSSVECLEVAGEEALVYGPVRARGSEQVGFLAALVRRSQLDEGFEAIEEALQEVSACIGTEYGLSREVTGLADELSGRYEELNLIYSLEDQTRVLDQGMLGGARILLTNFTELLNVDLAAFVVADEPSPIFATHPSRRIVDLDLVLTELRGNLFRFVAACKKPLILNDADDPRRNYFFVNMGYQVLAVPVVGRTSVDAMLVLLRNDDESGFSNGDRNLAQVIASQTAIIMRNRKMMASLRQFGEQMAGALIEAVEAKDPYTRGHSERVQTISTQIGRGAGLGESDVKAISWGALLHDVGKIGIPDRILCKAGRLTEDEYTLVKIHPERSYDILRHIEHLDQIALDAARYHHEKFDGTGYPHGLAGRRIPVHARVVGVADTYDAITSSRAYRAGQSHEAAMAEIRRVAGSQLDPEFVSVFEKMLEEDARWLMEITAARTRDHE